MNLQNVFNARQTTFQHFQRLLTTAKIKEVNTIGMSEDAMVKALVDDMAVLIELEREILDVTEQAEDEGTNDMVNGFMQYIEKNTWMLRSFLNQD